MLRKRPETTSRQRKTTGCQTLFTTIPRAASFVPVLPFFSISGMKIKLFSGALVLLASAALAQQTPPSTVPAPGLFHEIELAGSETLHTSATFKLGGHRVYGLVSIAKQFSADFHWALGGGVGTRSHLGQRWVLSNELLCYTMTERDMSSNHLDLLAQFRPALAWQLGSRWQVFAGPTLSVAIAELTDEATERSHLQVPYALFKHTGNRTQVAGWIGVTGGLRF
jgi:hypothetical protein